MSEPMWLWWSGGKDAAWALQRLRQQGAEVTGLVTTLDEESGRVPYQGVGEALLRLQAGATGLPLWVLPLPATADNNTYARRVGTLAEQARAAGVKAMAFGDLALADVRRFREELFGNLGFACRFPLWGAASDALAREMIDSGLEARLTCVDPRRLDASFLGRPFDEALLTELPAGVDPCGEAGEFHTFVSAGPMLDTTFDIALGEPEPFGEFRVVEPVLRAPLDGTLDLHAVPAKEAGPLVDDYLDACRAAGILQVRVVHGKGIGVLRETVHAHLRRRDDVEHFTLAGEGGGGWGATLVHLRPAGEGAPG